MDRKKMSVLAVVLLSLLHGSLALADCAVKPIAKLQRNIQLVENSSAKLTRRSESLTTRRTASVAAFERARNRMIAERMVASVRLENLKDSLTVNGLPIGCTGSQAECEGQGREIQETIASLTTEVLLSQNQELIAKARADMVIGLLDDRIQRLLVRRNLKIERLYKLRNAIQGCQFINVIRPLDATSTPSRFVLQVRLAGTDLSLSSPRSQSNMRLGIIVDGDPVSVGSVFPDNGKQYITTPLGEFVTLLSLSQGEHQLKLQALDAGGVVVPDFETVARTITVQ